MSGTSKIPIQNIYFLLCYAWNKLEEKDILDVSGKDLTSILDLFSRVLISGLNHLIKRGIDQDYVTYSKDSRCLRGKINFQETLKRNLMVKAQLNCEFDEFDTNILHNQILKAVIKILIFNESVDAELKKELIGLYRKFHEIDDIKLSSQIFSKVQLNSNNSFYDFLLKVCELIFYNTLITEDPGKSKFRDFIRDENQMAHLFEDFVRNFFRIELPESKVGREDIYWNAKPLDEYSKQYLPKMITDISIETNDGKVIIDTKYYKEALSKNYDQEKIHSSHMYQLFSYLKNIEVKGGINKTCSGMLLYPTLDSKYEMKYEIDNHKIMIKTINLNQDWKLIRNDMLNIYKESIATC